MNGVVLTLSKGDKGEVVNAVAHALRGYWRSG